jgi:type II secretory pathway pseudopilin PulG
MLLEVMLSMALLSIGIVIALQSLSTGLRVNRRVEDTSIAIQMAQAKTAQLLVEDELEDGTSRGDFKEEFKDLTSAGKLAGFTWEVNVTSVPAETWKKDDPSLSGKADTDIVEEEKPGKMKLIEVAILWKTHGKDESFKTSTWVWRGNEEAPLEY